MEPNTRSKIKSNFAWLTVDKVLAIFHSLIVGAIVARYLGPANFGILAFAGAICLTIKPIVSWGSDAVVTREFVKQDDRGELFWTSFFARCAIGAVAFLLVGLWLLSGWFEPSSNTESWVILIYAVPLVFSGFELANFILRAELLNRTAVVVLNIVLMFVSASKLLLVYNEMNLVWFAAVNSANTMFGAIAIYFVTNRMGLIPKIRLPSKNTLRELLRECWPLILSSLSVVLYMNVDCAMLRIMKGTTEAGIYTVAVRLSMVWYFIPVVLGTSFMPWLTRTYHERQSSYLNALKRFFEINALMSYACVLVALTIFPSIIHYLFGPDYAESISVFRWHVFGVIFVFMGTARGQHLNLAKLHVFNMVATTAGMIINVLLNLILIPKFASHGAAIATVVSFGFASMIMTFFWPTLFDIARLQIVSWLVAPFKSYSILREVVRTR